MLRCLRTAPALLSCVALLLLLAGCRTAQVDETIVPAVQDTSAPPLDVATADLPSLFDAVDPANDASETDAPPPADIPDVPFGKAALLYTGARCALDSYEAFASQMTALQAKCEAWAAEPASPAAREAAQQAFHAAMDSWQLAEAFRFGPLGPSSLPGGQDLRDQIESWPLFSRCKVEENLVAEAYTKPEFATSLVNGRTLSALEYLLFYPGSDNVCSQFSPANGKNGWQTLTAEQLLARKAAFAAAAAKDVAGRAQQLVSAWSATGGNYLNTLTTAGKGSALFASEQAALNTMSDALFFLDKDVKDWKVGKPAGVLECTKPTCPEAVESPYAGRSVRNVILNLMGTRQLFAGCGPGERGVGFDDWLQEAGAAELSAELTADFTTALSVAAATPDPLQTTLGTNLAQVQGLHVAIKAISDDLKTTFVSVLNLDLPKTVEGDND